MTRCSVCGGTHFVSHKVLWPELIAAWELSAEEAAYIGDQQGCVCTACGASLRIVALGDAIRDAIGSSVLLRDIASDPQLRRLGIVDVNGAVAVSSALATLPGYVRANYPAIDMEALPYPAGRFELVVHSDTLEHVPHPLRALEECRRVLTPAGRLCFIVPAIVGRLTPGPGWPASENQLPATTAHRGFVRHPASLIRARLRPYARRGRRARPRPAVASRHDRSEHSDATPREARAGRRLRHSS